MKCQLCQVFVRILEDVKEKENKIMARKDYDQFADELIAAVGGTVTALKRLRLGGLWLDKTLAPGEFRELTQEELEKLTSQT